MKPLVRAWGPVAVWLMLVAANSTSLVSLEHVRQLAWEVAQALGIGLDSGGGSSFLERALDALRKPAHLFEYAVLALLAYRALSTYRPRRPAVAATLALCLAFVVGSLDELHQHAVPERTGSPRDVFIDTAGAALGLLVAWLSEPTLRRRA